MNTFEATTLDIYDDRGLLLKELCPNPSEIPDFVKTAEQVTQRDHSELFAVTLHENGKVLKKFATADAGNTWLSTLYFYGTHDRLPEEAQKVAAANLIKACENFDIAIPDFLFEVLGSDGGVEYESNLVDVTDKKPPMQKMAYYTAFDPASGEGDREEVVFAVERADGTKYYPLKDASSVKVASDYFERNHRNMVPRERREYAVKTAAVARKGLLPTSDSIQKYASEGYSPNLEGHLTTRYLHLVDANAGPEVKNRLVKMASLVDRVEPEDFAEALEQFDRETGLDSLWDRHVADPWYSTFAIEKVAKGAVAPPVTFDVGDNITVTEEDLKNMAVRGKQELAGYYGSEMANSFEKDPVAVFQSMPTPQKKILARLASSYTFGAGK